MVLATCSSDSFTVEIVSWSERVISKWGGGGGLFFYSWFKVRGNPDVLCQVSLQPDYNTASSNSSKAVQQNCFLWQPANSHSRAASVYAKVFRIYSELNRWGFYSEKWLYKTSSFSAPQTNSQYLFSLASKIFFLLVCESLRFNATIRQWTNTLKNWGFCPSSNKLFPPTTPHVSTKWNGIVFYKCL